MTHDSHQSSWTHHMWQQRSWQQGPATAKPLHRGGVFVRHLSDCLTHIACLAACRQRKGPLWFTGSCRGSCRGILGLHPQGCALHHWGVVGWKAMIYWATYTDFCNYRRNNFLPFCYCWPRCWIFRIHPCLGYIVINFGDFVMILMHTSCRGVNCLMTAVAVLLWWLLLWAYYRILL